MNHFLINCENDWELSVDIMATNGSANGHRTDGSVESIITEYMSSHLALKGYEWTPIVRNGLTSDLQSYDYYSVNSSQRTKIVEALKALGRQYVLLYEEQLSQMCDRLEISGNTAMNTLSTVSNELFIEGIKWNHIITFLVFGSEFAFNCVQNGFPNLVNEVLYWMTDYVDQHLSQWIERNGRWVCKPTDNHLLIVYSLFNSINYHFLYF